MVENQSFDLNTGLVSAIQAGPSNAVANFSFGWDTVGNLVNGGSNGQGTLLTTITSVDPIYLYEQAFTRFNMGYASAMSVVMLIVALALTLLILRNSRRWVYYQGEVR